MSNTERLAFYKLNYGFNGLALTSPISSPHGNAFLFDYHKGMASVLAPLFISVNQNEPWQPFYQAIVTQVTGDLNEVVGSSTPTDVQFDYSILIALLAIIGASAVVTFWGEFKCDTY